MFSLFIYKLVTEEDYITNGDKYRLQEDGLQCFRQVLNNNEVSAIIENCDVEDYRQIKYDIQKLPKIRDLISKVLNDDYIFQDYIIIIRKSSIHTCHRDNNSIFFNEKQRYPSYTIIFYLEEMEKGLGVIPRSHLYLNSNNVNWTNNVEHISCNPGDVLLFNASLLHVGCINKKEDNLRIQMKLTHKNDIEHIHYYQNYNKLLDKENHLPIFLRKIQKNLSCMFPYLSTATQIRAIQYVKNNQNEVNKDYLQQIFSYLFYGDKDFYELPNAF